MDYWYCYCNLCSSVSSYHIRVVYAFVRLFYEMTTMMILTCRSVLKMMMTMFPIPNSISSCWATAIANSTPPMAIEFGTFARISNLHYYHPPSRRRMSMMKKCSSDSDSDDEDGDHSNNYYYNSTKQQQAMVMMMAAELP